VNGVPSFIHIQTGGKIDVGVSTCVYQLNGDGTLDTGFGGGSGQACNGNGTQLFGMALQSTNGIVILSQYNGDYVLERFSPLGVVDSTFGTSGYVYQAVSAVKSEVPLALAVQPDNKIVVLGQGTNTSSQNLLFVSRHGTSGGVDSGFGTSGFATLGSASSLGVIYNAFLSVVPSGAIAVAADVNIGREETFLGQLTSAGANDTSFGAAGGEELLPLESTSYSTSALVTQADGSLVVAGNAYIGRVDSGGSLDFSFGGSGIVTWPNTYISALALDGNGEILAGGQDANGYPVLGRFWP
jgi:uncharacterized delta-60 repeat protein